MSEVSPIFMELEIVYYLLTHDYVDIHKPRPPDWLFMRS